MDIEGTVTTTPGGVQTVGRALELLESIADGDGSSTLSSLAAACELPVPTAFRLLRSLLVLGYVRQLPSKRYALGARLIRLGESASHALSATAEPFLRRLVESTEETANMAMLEGDMVVYAAQVPSKHAMRMFTEVGRRVSPHCTGVGKVLLAQKSDAEVMAILKRVGMKAMTPHTITDPDDFFANLELIRTRGWAEDNEEQEIGVRCLAVAVPGSPLPAAISVSGPGARITNETTDSISELLLAVAGDLSEALNAE